MFFEGSEKKLEIVFSPELGSLRQKPRSYWESIVKKSNAEVLSLVSNQHSDAYLLSESSLFVFDDKLVMITCGRTSLVHAAEEILESLGVEQVRTLFYERKNEILPHQQPSDFQDDVCILRAYVRGRYYTFGQDDGNHVRVFYFAKDHKQSKTALEDMTLEILMHDLSDRAIEVFESANQGPQAFFEKTQIREIIPNFACDDYLFEPMGYSLNAIGGPEYYTIHVTPQKACSYASFETNHFFQADLLPILEHVLRIFEPRSFAIMLFENEGLDVPVPSGYRLNTHVHEGFCGYGIRFLDYSKIN